MLSVRAFPALAMLALLCAQASIAGDAAGDPAVVMPGAHVTAMPVVLDAQAPPGRMVEVGPHRLHLFCLGTGTPTVVLESGLGGFSLEWGEVQRALAKRHRVCSYDRAGYGWSDPGPAPRTVETLTEELHRLLERALEPAPYLLVGHSFGGYIVQLFAKRHPDLVAGLVLVDSSHPRQFSRFPPSQRELYERGSRRRTSWGSGVPALPRNYPAAVRELASTMMQQPKTLRTLLLEYRSFPKGGDQVEAAGPLPTVPAVVLTRTERQWPLTPEGDQMEALWPELQNDLAANLPLAKHFTIANSGHHIHLDQPAAIVEAVGVVIESAACAGAVAAGHEVNRRGGAC